LVAVDAEKLTITCRRPPHKKWRQETQSTAAFFKPSTALSGATAAAMLEKTEIESPKTPSTTLLHCAGICSVTAICAYFTVYGPTSVVSLTKRLLHLILFNL
jgi:hypothetical protein